MEPPKTPIPCRSPKKSQTEQAKKSMMKKRARLNLKLSHTRAPTRGVLMKNMWNSTNLPVPVGRLIRVRVAQKDGPSFAKHKYSGKDNISAIVQSGTIYCMSETRRVQTGEHQQQDNENEEIKEVTKPS